MNESILQLFFLIFFGAAVLASVALYTRQPIIVAYIAIGIFLGPYGLEVVPDISFIMEMSHIGIIFLLFLLGLDMQPSALLAVLKKATSVAILSSCFFAAVGFSVGWIFDFNFVECVVIGIASMFSSTIIGIKLLPTTVLHHKHSGELIIGLLLIQDIIAIFCLLIILSGDNGHIALKPLSIALAALPLLVGLAFLFVRYVLLHLIRKFDRFHEYIFLVAIGWCLALAELAELMHLSAEIGAFIAGVSLATSPIAQYIALSLKPLRDFFLVLFFFALGAQLNIDLLPQIAFPAIIYAGLILVTKPVIFSLLLRKFSERKALSWDVGFRLGQISEFSLLISLVAADKNLISNEASLLIQSAAIISFVISSYIVTFSFPNPIAVSSKLRRD